MSSVAAAEDTTQQGPIYVDFDYGAPPACMDGDDAFSLVHRRSARVERTTADAAAQSLEMHVEPRGNGYRGVLTVRRSGQEPEERSMTGSSCNEVVEALALTAALSIDPRATLTLGPAISQDQEGEAPAVVRTNPSERVAPETPPGADIAMGPAFSMQKFMDHAVHVGVGFAFSLSKPGAEVFFPLEARISIDGFFELSAAEDESVVTYLFLSRLSYCPVRVGEDFSLLLCPTSQLGAIMAHSRGFEAEARATRFFATLGAEAWLRARVAKSGQLWLSPALMAPLTQREFAVEPGPEVLASTVNISWSLSTGVGFSF